MSPARIDTQRCGEGAPPAFTYNSRLQLASIRYANGATDLLNLLYSYTSAQQPNNNGQIQKVTWQPGGTEDTTKTQNYEYDAWYRIKKAYTTNLAQNGTWRLEWSYDRFGNMTSQSATGGIINGAPYSAPSQPQLSVSPATNRITNAGYSYDAAGNMTSDGSNTYTYDAENRLVSYNSGAATYAYGPHSLRIRKTVGSSVTTYVLSGFSVLAEYSGSTPALSQEYIYAGGSMLAAITPGSPETVSYRHLDQLSARVGTNLSAATNRTYGHYPFGETWYETGTASKWKFTTYERDGESALDYANFRYYIPRLARFCTPDPASGLAATPADPQSWNAYTYVLGDPVAFADSLGFSCSIQIGNNLALLSPDDQAAMEKELQALLDTTGADVSIGDASADNIFYLTIAQDPAKFSLSSDTAGNTARALDSNGNETGEISNRGWVFTNTLSTLGQNNTLFKQNQHALGVGAGRAGFHEFLHYALQLPNEKHYPGTAFQAKFNGDQYFGTPRPLVWHLTGNQIKAIQAKCGKKKGPGGGGGGGGGGAEGLIGLNQGLWLMMQSMSFQNWVNSIVWTTVWHRIYY